MLNITPNGIKRGHPVQCKLTGARGICAALAVDAAGIMRVGMAFACDDSNTSPDKYYWVPYQIVVELDPIDYPFHVYDISDDIPDAPAPQYKTGAMVRDHFTGRDGYISEICIGIGGDIQYCVEGPPVQKNGDAVRFWLDQNRIDVIAEADV